MIFRPGWGGAYADVMSLMDMSHMAYIIDGTKIVSETYRGVQISRALSPTTNGCFLVLARKVPETIGGWPIGPEKFGHLHENYSMRCLRYGLIPFYCDLKDKKKYIELNRNSNPIRSKNWYAKVGDRNLYLLVNPQMWEPMIE